MPRERGSAKNDAAGRREHQRSLRSNQARGAATPVQYHELPGSGKVVITLFVAENVVFPETE